VASSSLGLAAESVVAFFSGTAGVCTPVPAEPAPDEEVPADLPAPEAPEEREEPDELAVADELEGLAASEGAGESAAPAPSTSGWLAPAVLAGGRWDSQARMPMVMACA
jgi:hypothetical protein